jgi:hypothetical protein
MKKFFIAIFSLMQIMGTGESAVIQVPGDYPAIQAAIDASAGGDTILVAPGTYQENLKISKKSITLSSSGGPQVTWIDGGNPPNPAVGSTVMIICDQENAVVEGFTICNGSGTNLSVGTFGGGVLLCYFGRDEDVVTGTRTLKNNIIRDNSADYGAGVACIAKSQTGSQVRNCLVRGNKAKAAGGGIFCQDDSASVVSNTVTGNSAPQGGGICCRNAQPLLSHSILWGNAGYEGPQVWLGDAAAPSTLTVEYSNVEGGTGGAYVSAGSTLDWGPGSMDQDPMFFDGAGGDYHLAQDPPQAGVINPCVDLGDPNCPIMEGSTRTDGIQDSNIMDLGYHYPASSTQPVLTVPSLTLWGGWILTMVLGALLLFRSR